MDKKDLKELREAIDDLPRFILGSSLGRSYFIHDSKYDTAYDYAGVRDLLNDLHSRIMYLEGIK